MTPNPPVPAGTAPGDRASSGASSFPPAVGLRAATDRANDEERGCSGAQGDSWGQNTSAGPTPRGASCVSYLFSQALALALPASAVAQTRGKSRTSTTCDCSPLIPILRPAETTSSPRRQLASCVASRSRSSTSCVDVSAFESVSIRRRRAQTYAELGEIDLAVADLEFLLSVPSPVTVHTLRSRQTWADIRDRPAFPRVVGATRGGLETRHTCGEVP